MSLKFKELINYVSKVEKISVCFMDGNYENYHLKTDIPEGKYDEFYVYGIGLADVEFSLDVYSKQEHNTTSKNDRYLGCALEIMLSEEPRDMERGRNDVLTFKDFRNYLPVGNCITIVRKEEWSQESFLLRNDIPDFYNDLYLYGIGIQDRAKDTVSSGIDSMINKSEVIVLSKEPRNDI